MPYKKIYFTIPEKLKIIQEYRQLKNKKKICKKHDIQTNQLRKWIEQEETFRKKIILNFNAKTICKGREAAGSWFEEELRAWILDQREQDIVVSTQTIISKIAFYDPLFLTLKRKQQLSYVYRFMARNKLSNRVITHVGQKLSGHLLEIRNDFNDAVNARFKKGGDFYGIDKKLVVNMDQTAIFFEPKIKRTVGKKGQAPYPLAKKDQTNID